MNSENEKNLSNVEREVNSFVNFLHEQRRKIRSWGIKFDYVFHLPELRRKMLTVLDGRPNNVWTCFKFGHTYGESHVWLYKRATYEFQDDNPDLVIETGKFKYLPTDDALKYGYGGRTFYLRINLISRVFHDFECEKVRLHRLMQELRDISKKADWRFSYPYCGLSTITDRMSFLQSTEQFPVHCMEHGMFWTTFQQHRDNKHGGCPGCQQHGYNPGKAGLFYLLEVEHGRKKLYKIGITNNSVKERYSVADLRKIKVLFEHRFEDGAKAALVEKQLKEKFRDKLYQGKDTVLESAAGNMELFTINPMEELRNERTLRA